MTPRPSPRGTSDAAAARASLFRLSGERGIAVIDRNGRLIRVGDRVTIGSGITGVVAFSIDTDEFSDAFPREQWHYLGRGIMVRSEQAGLVHLSEGDDDIEVIEPASG